MPRRSFLAAFTLFALSAAAPLFAHLAVVKTAPADGANVAASPARVQVWFNQPPSERLSHLELQGPGGEVTLVELQVKRDERSISAAVPSSLGAGRYEVKWRTAGNDGHVMRGSFAFTIAPKE